MVKKGKWREKKQMEEEKNCSKRCKGRRKGEREKGTEGLESCSYRRNENIRKRREIMKRRKQGSEEKEKWKEGGIEPLCTMWNYVKRRERNERGQARGGEEGRELYSYGTEKMKRGRNKWEEEKEGVKRVIRLCTRKRSRMKRPGAY